MSLFTGRKLVGELERLGVGTWGPDVVRRWIVEEPACPVAVPGENGKPHRYRLPDVLAWLEARTERELRRGVSQSAQDRLERIHRAIRMFAAGETAQAPPTAPPASRPPDTGLQLTPPEGTTPAPVSPAKMPDVDLSGINLRDRGAIELLLEILHGRDPRTAKAAEEALRLRQKRLIDEGQLVPVDDAQRMTDGMAILIRMAIEDLPERIAKMVGDQSTHEQRLTAGQQLVTELLDRLEKAQVEPEAIDEEEAIANDA